MTRIALTAVLVLSAALGACSTTMTRDRIVAAPDVCRDLVIPIYFESDEAAVTPDGRRLLTAEARRVQGCEVGAISVLGLADAAGDPAANLELSRQRAASVADAIVKAGFPGDRIDTSAVGQAGAVTAQGQVPVRRRADVTIKLSRSK